MSKENRNGALGRSRWIPRLKGRMGHAIARRNGQIVLFGGWDGAKPLQDTHIYSSKGWQDKQPPHSPSARSEHAMAAIGDRVVLYGGIGQNSIKLDDTWEWDGTDWCQKTPTHHPPKLGGHAMAALGGKAVLFGGRGPNGERDETWEWDGEDWRNCKPSRHPERRAHTVLAALPAGNALMLFGGVDLSVPSQPPFNDTWMWNGTDWDWLDLPRNPEGRFGHSLAFSGTMAVLYGGMSLGSAIKEPLWLWDGTKWFPNGTFLDPSWRTNAAAVELNGEAILIGGARYPYRPGANMLGDTWSWQGIQWTLKDSGEVPAVKFFDRNAQLTTQGHDFGTPLSGAFTVEAWVYFPGFTGASSVRYNLARVGGAVVVEVRYPSPGVVWIVAHIFIDGNRYASHIASLDRSSLSDGWHHIACVGRGTGGGRTVTISVDGQERPTTSGTLQGFFSSDLFIGHETVPMDWVVFELTEFRLSSCARYGSSFKPLPFGARFANDKDTVGLWHFLDGYGARRFLDVTESLKLQLYASGDLELGPAS